MPRTTKKQVENTLRAVGITFLPTATLAQLKRLCDDIVGSSQKGTVAQCSVRASQEDVSNLGEGVAANVEITDLSGNSADDTATRAENLAVCTQAADSSAGPSGEKSETPVLNSNDETAALNSATSVINITLPDQSYHKHLLYHSNEKPHVCSTCGRAFKELSTLHNHERIHSGEKPFKCEVCGKCFRQRVSFLVHTRIHTGIMPYKCDVCQKSFRYKVSQRTHKCQPPTCLSDEVDAVPLEGETGQSLNKQAHDHTTDDISESFIKEFLENTRVHTGDAQNSPASAEIAAITAVSDCNGNFDEALLTKAIDDIVVESCNKMGIGNQGQHLSPSSMRSAVAPPPLAPCSDDCNSPTQKLQNMRLYSPQLESSMGDVVCSDSVDNIFPRFLLDDVGSNMM
ncbi:zinc finger protein with KRAB and SCAN domains 3 [Rhagoletis pomonella]|uniref:zinc finger protein with KRAB and SCAN domains 3 n=1 Tax=Rhagoletis pomonella TaxID=28610 RepID=UPI001783ED39|nr:zinc finger protein with KRAB and SCAN domains 3 [Rhagoletis pomonella]